MISRSEAVKKNSLSFHIFLCLMFQLLLEMRNKLFVRLHMFFLHLLSQSPRFTDAVL